MQALYPAIITDFLVILFGAPFVFHTSKISALRVTLHACYSDRFCSSSFVLENPRYIKSD